jgi:hypothetical protein
MNLWRPCSFNPIHSLTGQVGQPFASRQGDPRFTSWGCTNSQWNWVLLLAMSRYIGDPYVIRSLASLPFSGCFVKLHDNNVISQRLCCLSVGASLGFAPTVWRANLIAHHMPTPVPFHSLQFILLLPTQWLVRVPVKLLRGALWRPCYFNLIHSLTGPVGPPFSSCLGGQ